MNSNTLSQYVGLLGMILLLAMAPACAETSGEASTFTSAVTVTRKAWRLVMPTREGMSVSRGKEARALLARVEPSASGSNRAILQYLLACADTHAGNEDATRLELESSFAIPMAPESILGLLEICPHPQDERSRYVQCLAELLPGSGWRRQADGNKSRYEADVKPPRADVPSLSRAKMIDVAALMEKAGLFELAWRAYAEAIYAGFSAAWMKEKLDETWLSPEAAEYWYKAATCAYSAGNDQVAWGYLMKAAIFGTDGLYNKSIQTAKQWFEEQKAERKARPGDTVDRDAVRAALSQVVTLYQQMNMHPRAWALIDAYPGSFVDPAALRKEVQKEWLAVVKDVSREARKVTLYGQEVYPNGDPLKVTVPWCLSDEAMASVKERLGKVVEGPPASK